VDGVLIGMRDRRHWLGLAPARRAAGAPHALLALVFLAVPLGACDRGTHRPTVAAAAPPEPVQTGKASYYARGLKGRLTASGERHDPGALTAASPSLPLGSTAKVTNTENGRSVVVRIDDRGPHAKHRILDVSRKAADHLAFKGKGVAEVAVQPLSR
jgi:rare lipoprotein A